MGTRSQSQLGYKVKSFNQVKYLVSLSSLQVS